MVVQAGGTHVVFSLNLRYGNEDGVTGQGFQCLVN